CLLKRFAGGPTVLGCGPADVSCHSPQAAQSQSGDGLAPIGAPVRDGSGNIYGVTAGGGLHSGGTIFKIVPGHKTETVLYNFCSALNCTDGTGPNAGLTRDPNGNLFGTTTGGGANGNNGVVFELSGATYNVVYSFCRVASCTDGNGPVGGVFLDSSGNKFGATCCGGTVNAGVVYEIKTTAPAHRSGS